MKKQIDGQMSLFDIIPENPHDFDGDPDYQGRTDEISRYSIEHNFEMSIKLRKCADCFEDPDELFKGCHEYWVRCPKCGRETEHFDKLYKAMQAWNRGERSAPHTPPIHRFLRYGPHTLIPRARAETRDWLDRYGVPDWVKWEKDSLPCDNCTWYDGSTCRSGGHTCHYEYGYLICDGFYQSIVERTPRTVGDSFPSIKVCTFSGHTCNKSELWKVADTLDELQCPHVCCRKCNTKACGARCNGSEEPKDTVTMFGEEWYPLSKKPEGITQYDDLRILGPYKSVYGERWSNCPAKLCDGEIVAYDVPWDIPKPDWKYWRLKEKVYPLDIKGICDDPYCPQCGYPFETIRSCKGYEVDCERCPECHIRVDWTTWHRLNDKETEE